MSSSVVITGCGSGLGRAIFERLIEDGWAAVGLERDEARADEARAIPGAGDVIVGDSSDRADLATASKRAAALAPLGAWVNNAAVAISGNLHEPVADEVARLVDINLMGYYWGCAQAVQTFIGQRSGGAIVNISSIHARAAFNGWAAYDMAKGGVNALTRYVAVEYGPVGIRANAIEPGAIRTPLLQGVIDADADPAKAEYDMAALHPMGRVGEPEEIASVAAFLISSGASFLSGECIAVDGAATARCYRYEPDPGLMGLYGQTAAK